MQTYCEELECVASLIEDFVKLDRIDARRTDDYDFFAMLPHPRGMGSFNCGKPAYEKLRSLSYRAHSNSPFKEIIRKEDVFRELKNLFVVFYIVEEREINPQTSGEIIQKAITNASKAVVGLTHIFPVHLGHAEGVDRFQIGPVYFRRGILSKEKVEENIVYFIDSYSGKNQEYIK